MIPPMRRLALATTDLLDLALSDDTDPEMAETILRAVRDVHQAVGEGRDAS